MQNDPAFEEEEWIIWNGALGIRDFVTIGRVEVGAGRLDAWLEAPYDMVGPFSLDALRSSGRIGFAECIVMSQKRWREDQAALRRESFEKRRRAEQELFEELKRANKRKRRRAAPSPQCDEQEQRALLELPADGELHPSQIKAAYRKLAKRAHPDVGGSHELFVRITDARNALLGLVS